MIEWEVEILASGEPREAYPSASLLSRMKCLQTTLNISDLEEDVEEAIKRHREKKPFLLAQELAKKCHAVLAQHVSPYQFECMIRDYFVKNGALFSLNRWRVSSARTVRHFFSAPSGGTEVRGAGSKEGKVVHNENDFVLEG